MEPNPRKTTTIRRLGRVDVTELRDAVLTLPDSVWDEQDAQKPNRFDVLDATSHIVFRFMPDFVDWRESRDLPLWEEWRGLLEPVLAAATAPYNYVRGAFPRVMFARMRAGGVIKPHTDSSPAAMWPHKIHVPLATNPDVRFFTGGAFHHFEEGEAVEVNNMDLHAVNNRGSTDRVHLIFEYYDLDQPEPAWFHELLAREAS